MSSANEEIHDELISEGKAKPQGGWIDEGGTCQVQLA